MASQQKANGIADSLLGEIRQRSGGLGGNLGGPRRSITGDSSDRCPGIVHRLIVGSWIPLIP
jgi:hypothetical protein